MDKPILYIDVDGVLFGRYGGYDGPQLRPGVIEFLDWATKQFECKWMTSYPQKHLDDLFWCMYARHIFLRVEYVYRNGEKEDSAKLDSDFYWIEDDPLSMHPRLDGLMDAYGLPRYIEVSPYGEKELQQVKIQLSMRLLARGYMKDAIV